MVWAIGLIRKFNPSFSALRTRLLLSYLGVMVAILGTFGVTVYNLVARNLNQQLEMHLLTLAQTGATSLELVKHEYEELHNYQDNQEHYHFQDNAQVSENQSLEESDSPSEAETTLGQISSLMSHYHQGQITYPYAKNPPRHYQGVEWFDESGQLLIKEGNLQENESLPPDIPNQGLVTQKNGIRHYILPVYRENNSQKILEGYIRASESTEIFALELKRLKISLSIGGLIALGLTAVGGMWLTRRALQPIETSFSQLQQFTADASHELRSPLTAMKTTLSLFQRHPERVYPTDLPKIGTMVSATAQMTELVEDLLLLSRMDGLGNTSPQQWRTVPLEEILEDLVDEAEEMAQEKHITLQAELLSHLSVLGHPSQLKRLFQNILSNALKYTPRGGKVELSMQQLSHCAVVTCQDTGIGIAPEDVPYIFDRFWRADQARGGAEGGFGLGMAIAQSIARLHHGQITVTSELGQGSCFQVKLPLT